MLRQDARRPLAAAHGAARVPKAGAMRQVESLGWSGAWGTLVGEGGRAVLGSRPQLAGQWRVGEPKLLPRVSSISGCSRPLETPRNAPRVAPRSCGRQSLEGVSRQRIRNVIGAGLFPQRLYHVTRILAGDCRSAGNDLAIRFQRKRIDDPNRKFSAEFAGVSFENSFRVKAIPFRQEQLGASRHATLYANRRIC